MVVHYNFQQFKKALNRNFGKVRVIFYIGDFPTCVNAFFIETKKSMMIYNPESPLDAYRLWNMAKECFAFKEVTLGS